MKTDFKFNVLSSHFAHSEMIDSVSNDMNDKKNVNNCDMK